MFYHWNITTTLNNNLRILIETIPEQTTWKTAVKFKTLINNNFTVFGKPVIETKNIVRLFKNITGNEKSFFYSVGVIGKGSCALSTVHICSHKPTHAWNPILRLVCYRLERLLNGPYLSSLEYLNPYTAEQSCWEIDKFTSNVFEWVN